jgi:hypothetical protein
MKPSLIAFVAITATLSCAFAMFAHFKYEQMMQLVRQGIAPIFHDSLVQQGLVGASVLFGGLGAVAVFFASYQYWFGH